MRSLTRRILAVAWAGILGSVILVFGAGIWSALVGVNLSVSPAIPWAVPAMSVVLVLVWVYLAGKGWPRGTAEARRLCLRAKLVAAPVFGWSVMAGSLSVVAFAGLWIVMTQLVRMPGNALPDLSHYPWFTVAAMIIMGSVAAPLTEEPAFRGYCQVILEREFSGPVAVVISSVLFALAHGPTQGFLWPKLVFYFLVGVVFGTTAYLTKSILPAIPGHVIGLLIFFTLIWPHDAARRLVWQSGTDIWFWVHVSQTVAFAALTVWAFRRLAQVCNDGAKAKRGAA
ncbi:MAG TPA: CPBP family intramembrane glutamic endopeptidase [Terracidiphilus sp.]|nr:CPBP family intramembrane glutamic endopeptidase [Terracidiphilus sp.]